jgi:hypothetical protein
MMRWHASEYWIQIGLTSGPFWRVEKELETPEMNPPLTHDLF